MRSSAVLALFGASLAIAAPAHQALHKKAYVTDIVTDIVYVTVTAGDLPTSTPSTTVVVKHTVYAHHKPSTKSKSSTKVKTTSTTAPPPPPPTTTSTTPPPTTATPTSTSEPATVQVQSVQASAVEAPVAKAATTQAASATPTDYQSTALYHHKAHRANHTADALSWDSTLATYAETIAKGCVFAHDMSQGGGGYGQNLAAYGTTSDMDSIDMSTVVADAITNQWYYGEAANVPYGEDSPAVNNVPEFLHFTQVVWKGTTKVGCYTAQCAAGTIFSYHSLYTVCNYKSVGNVLGSFASEVTRPIGLAGITANIS